MVNFRYDTFRPRVKNPMLLHNVLQPQICEKLIPLLFIWNCFHSNGTENEVWDLFIPLHITTEGELNSEQNIDLTVVTLANE